MPGFFKIFIAFATLTLVGLLIYFFPVIKEQFLDPTTKTEEVVAPEVTEERERNEFLQTVIPSTRLAVGEPLDEEARTAIQTLKVTLVDDSLSPAVRSRNADALLGIYSSDRSPEMFKEIFSSEPFGQFAGLSEKEAIKAATLYILDGYPTSRSYLRLSNWYATELLDNELLPSDERIKYKTEALNNLAKADEVYASQEEDLHNGANFATMINRHWRGIVLGYLALADKNRQSLQNAQNDFVYVQSLIRQSRDITLYPVLPYSLFYEVALMASLEPEKKEEIETKVQELLELLESQRVTKNDFLRFVDAEGKRSAETRDHNYDFFTTLAKNSVAFELFLRNQSFPLDEVQ